MAQKKAHEVDAWLRRPDPTIGIVLLYGPDRGLVSERARDFARASGLPLDDAFSVTRLDAAEIEQQPGRLVDEARTVPMFADRRLIWVRNAGAQKALAEDLKALVDAPPRDALILVEAGDLKKGVALRAVAEAAPTAIALPCYADEGRSIDGIIDEEMHKAGLALDMDARQALRRALGGDRMASRGEIEKLVLYAAGSKTVTLADVLASTGDAAGLSVDDVVDATLEGRLDALEIAFRRLAAAGNQVFPILSATMRQFQALHGMRVGMEEKSLSAGAAVAAARPPVFYSRRKTVESALQRWSPEALARILARLQAAVLQTRRRPELAVAVTRQALMAIALDGGRRPSR